jgi:hypothetical protein
MLVRISHAFQGLMAEIKLSEPLTGQDIRQETKAFQKGYRTDAPSSSQDFPLILFPGINSLSLKVSVSDTIFVAL